MTGYVSNGADRDMAIWRYDSAGNPVGAFNGGLVTHHNAAGGGGDDIGYGIALSGTDVVVAGESEGANYADMAVWKYTSAGALKNEFNGTGYRTINGTAGGAGNDRGYAVAVDGTDIIVAGESHNISNDYDMVVWRLTNLGVLDNAAFGSGNGYVKSSGAAGGSGDDGGLAICLDGTDILVAGYSENGSGNRDMVIWKYDAAGDLDTAFGSSGMAVSDRAAGGDGNTVGFSIALDGIGRILVSGYSLNIASDFDMVLWRYSSAGALDTSFGNSGILAHNSAAGGGFIDAGEAVAWDAVNGRIVVAGYSQNADADLDMVVWRYHP